MVSRSPTRRLRQGSVCVGISTGLHILTPSKTRIRDIVFFSPRRTSCVVIVPSTFRKRVIATTEMYDNNSELPRASSRSRYRLYHISCNLAIEHSFTSHVAPWTVNLLRTPTYWRSNNFVYRNLR